jgi:hypothetical protein
VAGHHSREDNRAGAGSEYGRTGHRGQVNTAMTWPVLERRAVEGPNNGR